ncbi:MAG: hypothetical protein MJ237_01775 [bacterium]|nr:hypothetical protein [bacterium]
MKVNSFEKNNISFDGFYNSKGLKTILKFAENNGALFASATALTLSAVRPAIIMATPNTDKENKKTAFAKAISSAIIEACLTLIISIPIVKSVGAINKNPKKFLSQETIKNLQGSSESLKNSKAYTLATQMFKLGTGIIVAVPKSIATLLLLPFFNKSSAKLKENNSVESDCKNLYNPTFKGRRDLLTDMIAKSINNKSVQDFAGKFKDSNFPLNINVIKDIIATSTFAIGVSKSEKIKSERQGPLIYNTILSTVLSIILTYIADKATDKTAKNFEQKIIEANKNDIELKKYLDGLKIAKPILTMGILYYAFIPLISTFMAERINKKHPICKDKSMI